MPHLIDEVRLTGTISSGSLNLDFAYALTGIIKQIIVIMEHQTTTFDVTFVDRFGDVTYFREDEIGTLNELIELPVRDNYTIQIRNATADDDVVVKLITYEI